MEIRLQSIHFDADVKLVEFIEKKLNKLETFYDQIISADVMLKLENNGQVKDKIFEVKLNVPGNTILSKETCKTFEEAVDLGTDSLRRQIVKFKEKTKEH
jgi:putative sigma-54 modulation protein